MAFLQVRCKVQDYQTWRDVFDENFDTRRGFGCLSETVLVNANDEHEVVVLLTFEDANAARTFSQSTQLREGMQRSGIIPPPQITILEER